MKRIITDHLDKRLPANQNFLQYINEETRVYLIALCSALFPDSESKAYILSGITRTVNTNNFTTYSPGYVFYNDEIFYVQAFSMATNMEYERAYGLIVQTNVQNEEYKSGETLPAYEGRILVWDGNVSGPLSRESLIRRDFWDYSTENISVTSTPTTSTEAKVVTNNNLQAIIINLKINPAAETTTTGVRFPKPNSFRKNGLLGMGKVINKTLQKTFDVCVYGVPGYLMITRPYDPIPANQSNYITWENLWNYVNPNSGGVVIGQQDEEAFMGAGEEIIRAPSLSANAEVYLVVNLTHNRV